jgi:alkanesulfonate monooxygenase SsuD/methylene tetrahydromethanopterin reductase-like flavin-dependent oxidoreductase (luciferase family)
LLLGGRSAAAYRRAGRLADGWISASAHDLTRIGETIDVIKQSAKEAGRDAGALRFVVRGVVRVGEAGQADRLPLSGSYDEVRQDFAGLAAQGVTEIFVDLNFDATRVGLDIDPAASMAHAEEVLTALAP